MMGNEKRLIDCEQAKRATYEEIFWTESEQAVVRNFLAKLPKVDAVEVVCIEEVKQEILQQMDMFIAEYNRIGFYGKSDAMEIASRLVNAALTDLAKIDGGIEDGC